MNSDAFSVFSIRTMEPPNQSNTAIMRIPRNSLVGDARFCLFNKLFENLKKRLVECWNLSINSFSALKAFTIRRPPNVSSTIDRNSPDSF